MPHKDKAKRAEYMRNYRAKHPKVSYFKVREDSIEVNGEKYKVIVKEKIPDILGDALYFAGQVIKLKKEEAEKWQMLIGLS